ncbi:MAG: LytR C-terminal domain-containing protein [Gaiellaceae bacterium]
MDHPLAAPDALVRPWRLAAFVAGGIAAFELLLLLVIGGGALVHSVSNRLELAARDRVLTPPAAVKRKPAARKPAPTPVAKIPRGRTVVLVLNGNGITGAAASAASRVRSRGYRIGSVGNAPRSDFARSLVMFKPGYAGEGRRLARDLGVKQVGPLDGMRVRALGRSQLVFVLGS